LTAPALRPVASPEQDPPPRLVPIGYQPVKLDLSDSLIAEIAVVDPTGAIMHANRKWEETAKVGLLSAMPFGWNYIAECEAAIQRNCAHAVEVLAGLIAVLHRDTPSFVTTYSCPFNGRHHWFQVMISAFEFEGRRHAMLMHVDVSALQRDPLTGLPNRAMFDAQLELAISLARDAGRGTGVIIVDMNGLKLINDMHGHRSGDAALKALAADLKKMAGPDCVAARIGGDEFGVVLPADYDTLSRRRMRAHFGSGIVSSIGDARYPISISASVGMAFYPDDGITASELLGAADTSMYAQKRGSSVA
jgi:diguanylate cyclase (GGDEF)-like protein